MFGTIKLSVIAAGVAIASLPLIMPQAANSQGGPQRPYPQTYPQQAQQPPRGGAWGDRDRDGIPNQFDRSNDNRRGPRGDQDHDGIPNRYDRDRDGDGTPNRWDSNPANPYRR